MPPRRTHRKRRRRKPSRKLWRLAIVLIVLALSALVYLRVSLAQRFDGRLWMLPSRVYSDVLLLEAGDPVEMAELTGRLDRTGYARVSRAQDHPGQYSSQGSTVDVFLRPF